MNEEVLLASPPKQEYTLRPLFFDIMAPLYRKALVVGATSGIGEALAGKLVSEGSKVIAIGRRTERLVALQSTHGADKVSIVTFDVSNLNEIPAFAATITKEHPNLDCVIYNSGVQRAYDFTKPSTVDLNQLGSELTVNYLSAVHLTTAFLPHFQTKENGNIVFVSATLGLIPGLIRTPNYNASKSALHTWIMDVRQQLKEGGYTGLRIVEVFPPAVQTELHDTKHQPDLVNGGEIGMPLDAYTERMYEGLVKGEDQFAIGPGEKLLAEGGWECQRQKLFEDQNVVLRDSLSKYIKK